MTAWQYKILPYQAMQDTAAVEALFNQHGAQGWEIISINQNGNSLSALMKMEGEAAAGAPINLVPPALSKATAVVGDDLTCSPGTWEGGTVQMVFQWQRAPAGGVGVDIPGQSNYIYVAVAEDIGASIRCKVTATNDGGSTTAKSEECIVTAA